MDYPADLQLVPDAVVTKAGREAVEYHAEINAHRGKTVGLAWQADVVDDRGRAVMSKLAVGTAKSTAGQTQVTPAILAAGLPDGYYMLRFRAAISPDAEPPTMMQAIQYVNVSSGKWREMTDVQWRNDSKARLAFSGAGMSAAKGGRR